MLLTAHTFTTLDGVMQGPGAPEEDTAGGFGLGGWQVPFPAEGWGPVVDGWFTRTEALLLGRRTFEMMRDFWTQVTDPDDRVATVLNHGRKYLVSTTLSEQDADWAGTAVIGSDVVDRVAELTAQGDGELQVHGSWQLLRTLHDAGLVDVFRILQFPVVLGSGKRLFEDAPPTGFEVLSAQALPGGVVSLELRRASHGTVAAGDYTVDLHGQEQREVRPPE